MAALAIDLQALDANPIKVGSCDYQVRFNVKLLPDGSEHDAKNSLASYRVGVYSTGNKALLTTFSVSEQKIGDNFTFVVPSPLLRCESGLIIVVDDKKNIQESNRNNNSVVVNWIRPGSAFGSPCAEQLERCRK